MHARTPGSRALLGAVIAATVVSMLLRVEFGAGFFRGEQGVLRALAVLGVCGSVAAAALLWRSHHRYARMRERSERSGAEMSAVMATSHEWLWESTPDLVFVACSASTSELLGYEPDELIGRSAFELVDPEFVPAMRATLALAVHDRTGWRDQYARWQHRDGHLVDALGSADPLLGPHGEVVGFRGARQTASDGAGHERFARTLTRVRNYLDQDQLTVALQPVISLRDGAWHNAEALARFPDGRSPETCFAEAREVGLGVELELRALRRALDHLAVLPPDVSLSVNVSDELLADRRACAELMRAGIDPRRVVLEITEHDPVEDYDALFDALTPLRMRGMRVAIDDTGSGYSSFRHVLRLRPDVIKLDRSLLQDVTANPAARALVSAVVMFASEIGATVTAEGVEDDVTLRAVALLGVEDAQGYFLARPSADPVRWAGWQQCEWSATLGRHRLPA